MLHRFTFTTAVLVFAGAISAQVPPPSPAPSAPAAAVDPLGRDTPRGTVIGFLREAGDGKYPMALQYIESNGRPADSSNTSLRDRAQKLKTVLDSDASIHLSAISGSEDGTLDDGLPADTERIATIETRDGPVDITLHRVSPRGAPRIWLFSPETMRRVPDLYSDVAPPVLEQLLPQSWTRYRLFNVPAWRWIALLIWIPVALGIAWLIARLAVRMASSLARRTPVSLDDIVVSVLQGPLMLLLTVWIFHAGMVSLDLPLLIRRELGQLELVLGIAAIAWFALRLIDIASSQTRDALVRNQRLSAVSMVPLGRRVFKILAVAFAILIVLDNAGFDLKAVLTGLGVGGIAVALAAQRTLENFFGALAVVLDQPVRVGDFCKFGDQVGTVDDIGLRSTRIRTLDRTIISIPNATFSTINLENFGPREKLWFHPVISLRLDTTVAQVRCVLQGIRELLDHHPKIETGGRIRLSAFGKASINLEVFSYVGTSSYDEFVVIQEELLLRILEIIEKAGTSLAMPSQSSYITRSPETDIERAREIRC